MKYLLLWLCCLPLFSIGQSINDTTIVHTLKFSDITKRRGWYNFPDGNTSYSKILMYYTLKCDAATTQDNYPCGEWDYTTYTDLFQHFNIGSQFYNWGGDMPDSVFYLNQSPFDIIQHNLTTIQVDSVITESEFQIVQGNEQSDMLLNTLSGYNMVALLLDTVTLYNTGITAGTIGRLRLECLQGIEVGRFKLAMAHSSVDSISNEVLNESTFQTVFDGSLVADSGYIYLNFSAPFNWNGLDNILLTYEVFSDANLVPAVLKADSIGSQIALHNTSINGCLNFESGDYVLLNPDDFDSIQTEVTLSAWVYGNPQTMPINSYLFEGVDASGQRVINVHLPWSNGRVYWDCGNNGGAYDRLDEAALFDNYAGKWNHWAFTKNTASGSMKIYLNGNLFASATGKTLPINAISRFKIGGPANGTAGRYDGKIDQFKCWNKELSQSEIQEYMYTNVLVGDANYSNLLVAYDFDEDMNGMCISSNGAGNGMLYGEPSWQKVNASDLILNLQPLNFFPNLTLLQGTYEVSSSASTWNDTLFHSPVTLIQGVTQVDTNMSGITYVDADTSRLWKGNVYTYIFDENGAVLDSTFILPDSILVNLYVSKRHQLQNYVTPYGIGLNLGPNGFRWVYDVTDYAPILRGLVEISAGNQQELIDLKFLFIEGTPAREVLDFETIWLGDYNHADIANNVAMPAVSRLLRSDANQFTVKTRTTGHWFGGFQNCAEFCPKNHHLKINGTKRFEWLNWKDCASNPVINQGGTWVYDRAGWCPGTFADTYDHNITPFVSPGQVVEIDYGMETTAGGMEGNYRTTVQLISYGNYNFVVDAEIEDIISPNKWEMHNRVNPVCDHPQIKIKNNGANNITSVDMDYWICGDQRSSFHWEGDLAFGQSAVITLPIVDLNFWNHAQFCKIFNVEIMRVNNQEDEYSHNNFQKSYFNIPPVYPSQFFVWYKSNASPTENELFIYDLEGNEVYHRFTNQPNTNFKDTLDLLPGCYKMVIKDYGEDGLAFFANTTQGSGFIMLRKIGGGTLKNFETDFGDEMVHYFSVDYAMDVAEMYPAKFECFPNPFENFIRIDLDGFSGWVTYKITDIQGRTLIVDNWKGVLERDTRQINNLVLPAGVYNLEISDGIQIEHQKIVKQ